MPKHGGTSQFGLGRLLNLNKSAEGGNLLPPQVGEFRVPFATNLTLVRAEFLTPQTFFTLMWSNVDLNNVSHYSIYVIDAANSSNAPIGIFQAPVSPIRIPVIADEGTRLLFRVQTVLNNGFSSNLNASPTCTSIALG